MVKLRLGAPRLPSQSVCFSPQSHDIDVLAADHGRASWTLACDSAALLHAVVMLATHGGACLCADQGCTRGMFKSMPNTQVPGTG